ncbi:MULTISPECIES: AbrB/MazE/SpoVT family DNA-binding domain-containing protein [Aerococcus]|uniref:AbrB family transcriptional regulator n=1 Tax=Aerococcus tenax TaxID=3078812 RepID=A0A5N1BU66_9LACT|nr:AbrB family transcriptional regulator [Aerococcus urinae]KAA9242041.1 AbrB family transcriptional regulator [Aerococcus urinae]MDK7303096.1 AbrB family transcriptional regulator [Aerococcus urinae]MDK7801378.1 AbrB family transcriptional regulator [Aerococcus urinae]MDK8655082.1 AbrB family transcriptional regulator [Aerococcus urinae]RAV70874.1 AbrB family transcriptional regulator [Aerococcus urinae]
MANKLSARVIKIGNSQAISLSKTASKLANFQIGDQLELKIENESIQVTKKDNHLKDKIKAFYKNGGLYEEELIDYVTPDEEW